MYFQWSAAQIILKLNEPSLRLLFIYTFLKAELFVIRKKKENAAMAKSCRFTPSKKKSKKSEIVLAIFVIKNSENSVKLHLPL